jgi:hypothetical protein
VSPSNTRARETVGNAVTKQHKESFPQIRFSLSKRNSLSVSIMVSSLRIQLSSSSKSEKWSIKLDYIFGNFKF